MISKTMTQALNKQINAELYSAYLYLAMSAQCSFESLKGAANWFFVQAQEEMTHALRLYYYVNDVGELALLKPIEGPPTKFESIDAMFATTLEHEKKVTAMINNLADLAEKEKDHATRTYMQWFVNEQVEEESNAREIIDRLKLAGKGGLFIVDNELAARAFVFPPDLVKGGAKPQPQA